MTTIRLLIGIEARNKLGTHLELALCDEYQRDLFRVVPVAYEGTNHPPADAEMLLRTLRPRYDALYFMSVWSATIIRPTECGPIPIPVTSILIVDRCGLVLMERTVETGHYLPYARRRRLLDAAYPLPRDILGDLLAVSSKLMD